MELRDYIKIISRHFWIFIIVVILSTIFAIFLTKTRPTTYTAATTYTINKGSTLKQSQVNYYLYDNYYNLQSATLFSQNVQLWFSSPAFVAEIYKNAGLALPDVSQKALGRIFNATYQIPNTIQLSVKGTDANQVQTLIDSAFKVAQEKINQSGDTNDDTAYYQLNQFDPILNQNKSNLILNASIGFFSGIILGLLITFAVSYFKEEK